MLVDTHSRCRSVYLEKTSSGSSLRSLSFSDLSSDIASGGNKQNYCVTIIYVPERIVQQFMPESHPSFMNNSVLHKNWCYSQKDYNAPNKHPFIIHSSV